MSLKRSLAAILWLSLVLIPFVAGHNNCQGGVKCLGENGEAGPKGIEGMRGPRGHPGTRGMRGPPGPVGPEGFPGDLGEPGDNGFPGSQGPAGPPGPPGFPGAMGDRGAVGMPGPAGPAGGPGSKGDPGEAGHPGMHGPPGYRGKRGEPGEDGLDGFPGEKGRPGYAGPPGEPGCKGEPGECPPGHSPSLSFLVEHSQTKYTPSCPSGSTLMWKGYSLLYTEDDGRTAVQNLGTPGSCLKEFNPMPFMFCNNEGKCNYASRTGNSYWLSNVDETKRMSPIKGDKLYDYVSRCVVCLTSRPLLTNYSTDNSIPSCLTNYKPLWTGYNFLMHLTGAGGGGNHMTGSGACLQKFSFHPYIECGSHGTCHFFSDQLAYWMVQPQRRRVPIDPGSSLGASFFDEAARNEIIRCTVCIRR